MIRLVAVAGQREVAQAVVEMDPAIAGVGARGQPCEECNPQRRAALAELARRINPRLHRGLRRVQFSEIAIVNSVGGGRAQPVARVGQFAVNQIRGDDRPVIADEWTVNPCSHPTAATGVAAEVRRHRISERLVGNDHRLGARAEQHRCQQKKWQRAK